MGTHGSRHQGPETRVWARGQRSACHKESQPKKQRPGERSGVCPEGREWRLTKAGQGCAGCSGQQAQGGAAANVAHVSPLASHPRGRALVVVLLCPQSHTPLSWPQGRRPLTSCIVPQLSILGPLLHLHSLPHPVCDPVSGFRPIHILMLFKLPTPVPPTSHPLSSRPKITSVLGFYRHHSQTSHTWLQPKPNLSPSELAIPYPVPSSKCQLHPSRGLRATNFKGEKKNEFTKILKIYIMYY